MSTPPGMVVLDLDGTLLASGGSLCAADLECLAELGRAGYVRAIASGRSVFSYRRALGARSLPVDYLIFSTGAGVCAEPAGALLRSAVLEAAQVERAAAFLVRAGLDFTVHEPIPENHCFAYHVNGEPNPDFQRRLSLYPDHSRPLEDGGRAFGPAAQLVAIVPGPDSAHRVEEVSRALPELSVIRATSPIDHESTWIEVFPPGVGKHSAAAWLAESRGLERADVLAVGNDYNDLDLLRWAGSAYVVANAPAPLRREFPTVASHERAGVAEAVGRWLAARP